jgi:phospholipase/lecithinase/hemolysin
VLNVPDVTLIPGLQPAFAAVSNANGGGATGAAAASAFQATVRQWLQAFNNELAARVGSDSRVAIVPFFADLNEEVNNPASFALTNVTGTACSAIGVNAGASCTSAALDANPPAGLQAGWWRTWAFADPLHPTPFGHQLLAASVNRALARAGWL